MGIEEIKTYFQNAGDMELLFAHRGQALLAVATAERMQTAFENMEESRNKWMKHAQTLEFELSQAHKRIDELNRMLIDAGEREERQKLGFAHQVIAISTHLKG
ncbi:hypothetical protein AB1I77_25595 [Bacillus paranthracis]